MRELLCDIAGSDWTSVSGNARTGQDYSIHCLDSSKNTCFVAGPVNLVSVLRKDFLLQIGGSLGEVGRAAEVPPIVLVGAKGEDFFALGGEAEIGRDDGKDAFFGEHGEEAGGDDVDAREGERKWRGAPRLRSG